MVLDVEFQVIDCIQTNEPTQITSRNGHTIFTMIHPINSLTSYFLEV